MNHLTVTDLEQAELSIIKMLQEQAFPEIVGYLKAKFPNISLRESEDDTPDSKAFRDFEKNTKALLNKMGCPLRSLDPVLHEGILRVGGRIGRSNLMFDAKHSIILPSYHRVVTLKIHHYHKLEGHGGINHVLNTIRQKYWIIKGREQIKKTLNECRNYRRMKSPFLAQQMAMAPLTPPKFSQKDF
jgi:hypothetical protein